MSINLNPLLHYPTQESLNGIKQFATKWLNYGITWFKSSWQEGAANMQNKPVAYVSLVAFNVLGLNSSFLMTRYISKKIKLEAMSWFALWASIHTVQMIAIAKISLLPIHPLVVTAISIATFASVLFSPVSKDIIFARWVF